MSHATERRLAAACCALLLAAQATMPQAAPGAEGTGPAPAADSLSTALLGIRVTWPDSSSGVVYPDTLPFGSGEILEYELAYGIVKVGRARLETVEQGRLRGHTVLQIRSRGKSLTWVDAVYPVRDEVQSWLDLDRLLSLRSVKNLHEGSYDKALEADYFHEEGVARYADGSTAELVPGSQDILTALYVVRSLPLAPGMSLHVPVHDNQKNYPLRVLVRGRETVATALGDVPCLVLEPYLESGGIFKSEGKMLVYLSEDALRLPVLLKARAPVGSFTSTLVARRLGRPLRPSAAVGAP
ncbi:MAG: DUF3108 domain-containing protein [Candidatus Krumholzibacteriota bacterium]|nr:DUF3108 domain-containing protein [Candidatus Krumholzibacteriota bacterium]